MTLASTLIDMDGLAWPARPRPPRPEKEKPRWWICICIGSLARRTKEALPSREKQISERRDQSSRQSRLNNKNVTSLPQRCQWA
jgi:hypothetical protein